MKRALLLNSDWSPLHFVSDWRAIRLMLNERAEVVTDFVTGEPAFWDDDAFTSPTKTFQIPATLRLHRFVNKRWKQPRFRKKVLFNRDGWKCQYCGLKLGWNTVTIDHLMPSSRGGQTSWLNCVTSCKPCNRRKDDRTPEEANMRLLKPVAVPSSLHFWDAAKSDVWHKSWDVYVPGS